MKQNTSTSLKKKQIQHKHKQAGARAHTCMHTPIPLSRSLYIQTTKVQYRVKWKGGVGRVESRKKLDKGNKDIESAAWYCLARDGRTRHCIELRTERSWLSSGEEKGSGRGGKEHKEFFLAVGLCLVSLLWTRTSFCRLCHYCRHYCCHCHCRYHCCCRFHCRTLDE